MQQQSELLDRIVHDHPFFYGMRDDYRHLIADCADDEVLAGGKYIYREGQTARKFYLILHGRVALEIHVPGKAPIIVETLKDGDLLGWSWMVPPHRVNFDARTLESTEMLGLDAACLMERMEKDHSFGYDLHKRLAPVIAGRVAAARRQMIDIYGHPDD